MELSKCTPRRYILSFLAIIYRMTIARRRNAVRHDKAWRATRGGMGCRVHPPNCMFFNIFVVDTTNLNPQVSTLKGPTRQGGTSLYGIFRLASTRQRDTRNKGNFPLVTSFRVRCDGEGIHFASSSSSCVANFSENPVQTTCQSYWRQLITHSARTR